MLHNFLFPKPDRHYVNSIAQLHMRKQSFFRKSSFFEINKIWAVECLSYFFFGSILTSLLQYNYINVLYHTIESCDVRYLCTYRQLHHLKKNTFLWDKNNPILWKYFPIRFFPLRFANCLKFRMLTTLCRRDLVPLTQFTFVKVTMKILKTTN